MGYPHITDLNLSQYSFNNAKPISPTLIPKPLNFASCTPINTASSPNNTHVCFNPSNNLASSHGDLATSNANDQASKAESSQNEQALGSSRWSPTPEQLLALEELYRRGTRTPSAAQIQQIASRLRRFGKIEGKNVFYWFQNHKARERQKRRRESETHQPPPSPQQHHHLHCDTQESLEKKESGTVTTEGYTIEQKMNKGPPPSTINEVSEECSSKHEVIVAATIAKSEANEWIQFQEKEFAQRKITVGRSVSTWQALELSPSPVYLMNNTTQSSLQGTLNISFKPHQEENFITILEDKNREDQTLELFPLRSNNGINRISKKDTQVAIHQAINTTTFTPNQYYEFLPLKN